VLSTCFLFKLFLNFYFFFLNIGTFLVKTNSPNFSPTASEETRTDFLILPSWIGRLLPIKSGIIVEDLL